MSRSSAVQKTSPNSRDPIHLILDLSSHSIHAPRSSDCQKRVAPLLLHLRILASSVLRSKRPRATGTAVKQRILRISVRRRVGSCRALGIFRLEASRNDALPRDQGYVKCFEDSDDETAFRTYWEWQRIHFPIVDPDTFYADYNAGKRNSEFVSPMLLDIIYAVGENFGPARSIERSQVYLKRAEAAIMTEIGTPRISTIQAILMMSMFQMGNGKIPVAWTLNGMSVALSTRLGLHIDSSGLVHQGIMPQVTHQARKDSFWAVFVIDRLHSTIMGVHPLHSRRSVSTHRPSEPNRNPFIPPNIELAGVAPTPSTTPKTQELPAACWNTLRDLIDIVDYMLGDIYSFDAPKRTVTEDYDLVTKNMLTIQAYIDDMPSPLRVTAALRGNEPCLAFLHVYVNLFILLFNRPFVGPRPPSNANESEQQLERRCRSLAFAHCRKAALRIMELIRHLPRASPCFTTPYFIFSASTVLLLSPNDTQALRWCPSGLRWARTILPSIRCLDGSLRW
ncbi:hypothetical protein RSAG8_03323, partial [Rhizoctonia solani AG-8 WAC10335]